MCTQDTSGNRRYTFAELIMRAAGYPSPDFEPSVSNQVVLHARWLHGNPDAGGNIQYQAGTVLGMRGPRLDWVASELLAPGEISFTSDPQLGKAVVCASSWKEMCDRAVDYFTLRKPNIQGPPSTYAQVWCCEHFGRDTFLLFPVAAVCRWCEGALMCGVFFLYVDVSCVVFHCVCVFELWWGRAGWVGCACLVFGVGRSDH